MVKYEHMTLIANAKRSEVKYVNGRNVQQSEKVTLEAFLNQLSEKGWEVIGMAGVACDSSYVSEAIEVLLRKPKE